MEILEKFLTSIGIDILLDSGLTALYIIVIILEIIFLTYVIKELCK
jgi:ABC-type protease/lipase transport system fused ATPase/permease subunit